MEHAPSTTLTCDTHIKKTLRPFSRKGEPVQKNYIGVQFINDVTLKTVTTTTFVHRKQANLMSFIKSVQIDFDAETKQCTLGSDNAVTWVTDKTLTWYTSKPSVFFAKVRFLLTGSSLLRCITGFSGRCRFTRSTCSIYFMNFQVTVITEQWTTSGSILVGSGDNFANLITEIRGGIN